nr:hypothetical protein [Pseudobdellovibrionaceae bacterium]
MKSLIVKPFCVFLVLVISGPVFSAQECVSIIKTDANVSRENKLSVNELSLEEIESLALNIEPGSYGYFVGNFTSFVNSFTFNQKSEHAKALEFLNAAWITAISIKRFPITIKTLENKKMYINNPYKYTVEQSLYMMESLFKKSVAAHGAPINLSYVEFKMSQNGFIGLGSFASKDPISHQIAVDFFLLNSWRVFSEISLEEMRRFALREI